ncbi:MAG: hypothetical protein JRJ84_20255, partial [Deltaproteobacteria bacterium]|nr:hypothetical protein [Deltaproteobacteria bacterium]
MLQWLVLVLVAAVAAPKGDAPTLPVLSVPSVPLDGISPHARRAPEPPVTGGDSELDLERLARVQTSFRIGVDASALAAVDAASATAIARHLATDPRWRLMERDGVLMATERRSRGKERSVLWHGFHLRPREALRVAVRFGDWPTDAPYAASPFVSRVTATNPEMTVKSFVLSGDRAGWTATALCIEADHLALDIYEARPSKERPHTVQALSVTLPLLEGLADA